ncbi:winged helix-turn-helix domain-containing protein [Afipia sp. GAS231]|uniref:winged helix-turn-helix domain-containing protein n=1 Tax=Afipia sp. GAS231 TaxID=1882747 RepID=UPI00087AC2D6|nr:winged helix-turn-helix domain-containing protein [Afipia sp. GAS231]SDN04653.1 DNA-binding winged helix-turn-helix (wHTH) domain-containing protein [Afipia sp. GAS231]
MLFRFAGFELDPGRSELRRPGGEAIKLRPKTFAILALFAASPGRVLSKQELMGAVWPNVHVGDDSLFQCIREIRAALDDGDRAIVKLVSGRGYLFDTEVSTEALGTPQPVPPADVVIAPAAVPATSRRPFGLSGPAAFAAVAVLGAAFGLAIAAPMFGPGLFTSRPPAIAVMPITGAEADTVPTAAAVTIRLADGLAKIENIRVVRPEAGSDSLQAASTRPAQADFTVSGELRKAGPTWELRARLTRTATQEVVWSTPVSVEIGEADSGLQESRLAAGLGDLLARRLNELVQARPPASADGAAKGVVEQATAQINQTSKERFAAALTMLEKALGDYPDNADIQVALAAQQLRGIQMVWYSPADAAAVEKNAKAMLERALRTRPNSIPVLQAYCRFLNATNEFVESLVACARTLAFDPWDGMALYHMGLSQLPLGRFEDALTTFKQADRFDTPPVSRWTWLLGAGVSYLMMGRDEEALPWLERSIAITPASGRSLILLAAAYQRLGRTDEAHAALTQGLKLRPGSTVSNVGIPTKNVSAAYMEARGRIEQALIEAGLPEQ